MKQGGKASVSRANKLTSRASFIQVDKSPKRRCAHLLPGKDPSRSLLSRSPLL